MAARLRAIVVAQPSSTASGPITAQPASTPTTAASIHQSRSGRGRRGRRRRQPSSHSAASTATTCSTTSTSLTAVGLVANGVTTRTEALNPPAAGSSVRKPNTWGTGPAARTVMPSPPVIVQPPGPACSTAVHCGPGPPATGSSTSSARSTAPPGPAVTVMPSLSGPVASTVRGSPAVSAEQGIWAVSSAGR